MTERAESNQQRGAIARDMGAHLQLQLMVYILQRTVHWYTTALPTAQSARSSRPRSHLRVRVGNYGT